MLNKQINTLYSPVNLHIRGYTYEYFEIIYFIYECQGLCETANCFLLGEQRLVCAHREFKSGQHPKKKKKL